MPIWIKYKFKNYKYLLFIIVVISSCFQRNTNNNEKICNSLFCEYGETKNNKREGLWKRYDLKENLIQVAQYSNGLINGPVVSFYEDGRVYSTGYYINDTITGNMSIYFENGKLNVSSNYVNGIKEGFNYDFDDKGNLITKNFYLNGKRDGRQLRFDRNSNNYKIDFFREGNKIDTIINQ